MLRYSDNGRRVWETVGKDLNEALTAKKRREQIQVARRAGLTLQANGPTVVSMERKTLKSAVAAYESEMLMLKVPRSARADMFDVNQFTATCSKTYMDEINREDMLRFIQALRNHSPQYAPCTIYNKTMAIVAFLNCHGIKKCCSAATGHGSRRNKWRCTRMRKSRHSWLHRTQCSKLVIRFFLGSGCREGEVMHACYLDINYAKRTFTVQAKPQYGWSPKTGEGTREIPIGDRLLMDLKDRQASGPTSRLIFPARNGGVEGHFFANGPGCSSQSKPHLQSGAT